MTAKVLTLQLPYLLCMTKDIGATLNKYMQLIGDPIYNSLFIDHVAAFLFAISEADVPKEVNHYYKWFADYTNKYDGEEHSGDCTQQPWTCSQCLIDDFRERALTIINSEAFNQYLIDEELCVASGN